MYIRIGVSWCTLDATVSFTISVTVSTLWSLLLLSLYGVNWIQPASDTLKIEHLLCLFRNWAKWLMNYWIRLSAVAKAIFPWIKRNGKNMMHSLFSGLFRLRAMSCCVYIAHCWQHTHTLTQNTPKFGYYSSVCLSIDNATSSSIVIMQWRKSVKCLMQTYQHFIIILLPIRHSLWSKNVIVYSSLNRLVNLWP